MASAATTTESLTLKKIKETGVLSLGFRESSIPFSYLDERQRPIGYSMDLCMRVAESIKRRLGLAHLQVKLTRVTSATRLPMIANHMIDLECGTTTNNAERQKQVAFTVTTFVAHSRLASLRSKPMHRLEDLRGRVVVSTAGTTSIAMLVEMNSKLALDLTLLAGKDHVQSFRKLETRHAEAFAMDDVLLHGLIATSKDPSAYVISSEALSVEPYGIALRRDDPVFKKIVDDELISLFRSGEIETIYRRWFESPIPPQQVNLRLPMSPALRRVFTAPTDSPSLSEYSF